MKLWIKYYSLFYLVMLSFSCRSQSLEDFYNGPNYNAGQYYQDLNNTLTPFLGQWEYQNGNEIFKINFIKYQANWDDVTIDELHGFIFYTGSNGIKIIDQQIDTSSDTGIIGNNFKSCFDGPDCSLCSPGSLEMFYIDPIKTNISSYVYVRHYIENGVEKLILRIAGGDVINDDGSDYNGIQTIPTGDYIFTKI